jgi:hypothetical protein
MPIPMVLTSSDSFTGGHKYNRFGGPIYSGQVADNASGGPLPAPGAVALIQSTAPLLTQFVSTGAMARAGLVFIPQTTGTPVPDAAAPAYTGIGGALVWDSAQKTLCVYSTVTGAWMRPHQGTSSEGGSAIVWSSS